MKSYKYNWKYRLSTKNRIRLAKYATDNGIRFIYASSAATYGDGNLGFVDEHTGLDRLKPLNLYGFSKYYFDVWLKQHNLLDRVVGLKYFNVYGPNEDHKGRMASMVYKMFPVAYQKQAIRLFKSGDPISFADGEQKRDFIYVKDAVRMTCDFLENSLTGIFNIGSGMATSWNTLATALFKALGADAQIEYIDMPQSLAAQYQNYTCADMSKYKKALHTQKTTLYSIEEGVADYVQEHLLKDERW
ncbi:MAG: NAD-dependent epimerase/dehydratase family protein [Chlamydiales bacterium]|nr:NAD-dependent epimerase/dehydratase family protein [Chlamydiales bacterium]